MGPASLPEGEAGRVVLCESLDALRTVLLSGPARVGVATLAAQLRACNAALLESSQEEALDAARQVALHASDCLPLLRRAASADPDDEAGLAAAAADIIGTLSGSGTHTFCFAPVPSVHLSLRYTPQTTGTHGRVWRAAHVAARACDVGWGGVRLVGARVLELGCGTGALGLACAALGAASVWLTDVDEGALALARSNVALNALDTRVTHVGHLDVMQPEWEAAVAAAGAAAPVPVASGPTFDVVLAADIPFDFVTPSRLVDALAAQLARTPVARALLVQDGDPTRTRTHREGIHTTIELAGRHPALRCVASEEQTIPAIDGDGDGVVMHLRAYAAACPCAECEAVAPPDAAAVSYQLRGGSCAAGTR